MEQAIEWCVRTGQVSYRFSVLGFGPIKVTNIRVSHHRGEGGGERKYYVFTYSHFLYAINFKYLQISSFTGILSLQWLSSSFQDFQFWEFCCSKNMMQQRSLDTHLQMWGKYIFFLNLFSLFDKIYRKRSKSIMEKVTPLFVTICKTFVAKQLVKLQSSG